MRAKLMGDQRLYQGATVRDVLEAMRAGSRYPEASLDDWMTAYAFRVAKWDGKRPIDCSTVDTFWEGMKQRQHLTELD